VWNRYRVPGELAAAVAGHPVLLVDDITDTGWTLTVVGLLLRQAGASAVYPFVLGIAA
jgi:ATP-dependent DNA helicase RecQ